MTRITAIVGLSGGAGRTTTARELFSGLNLKGKKALAVDASAQRNLTRWCGIRTSEEGIYEAMTGSRPNVVHSDSGDIICGSSRLYDVESAFRSEHSYDTVGGVLDSLETEYDHIIIDCPRTLDVMTIGALECATDVIIPYYPGRWVEDNETLVRYIRRIRREANHGLSYAGFLFTMVDSRTTLHARQMEKAKKYATEHGIPVYETAIHTCVALKESVIFGENIYNYAPESKAAQDYGNFVDEYLQQEA